MKPRDLLLKRHQAMERKLDRIRQSTVTALSAPVRDRQQETSASWQAMLNPFRWHLFGLSAAWLVIASLNLTTSMQPSGSIAEHRGSSRPRDTLIAVRDNREQLLQLLEPSRESATPVYIPRRRGGLETTNTAV
jgi:hypothetical protein